MDIRDYWAIIWKRKFVVLLSVIILGIVGVIYTFVMLKATYEATAQILVDQPNRVIIMTDSNGRMPEPLSVETQKKLLKSRPVAERAVMILKNTKHLKKEDRDFAYNLINQIIATSDEDTGIIRLSKRGPDAKNCMKIVNAYAQAFEEISREITEKTNKETLAYIKEQLDNAEQALEEKEKNLYTFNVENGVVLLNEEIERKNETISQLEQERVGKLLDANQLEARLNGIRELFRDKSLKIMQNAEAFVNDTEEIVALRGNLNNLQVKRASLLVKYKPTHPVVKTLDSEIMQYEKQLEKYISDTVNHRIVTPSEYNDDRRLITDLETQLLVTRAKITNIDYIVNKMKQEQLSYPKLQYEYTRLIREKDIAEKLFLMLYEQHQQAQIEEVQRDVKVRVFERAAVPRQPISPNRPKNLMVAAMLGLMIGIAIAFLLEEMEETVRTSDDVKNYLNLPVLGSVPYSAETINKLIVDVPLKSPIAEAYRRLSFFTQLFCLDPPIKTLLITSSKSDEGKSTTLANLAISMAQEGTKVLVVDTDLRRPMLHRMFGVDNSLGVSSILTGELEAEIAISDLSVSGYLPKESFMDVIVDRLIQPCSIKGLSIIPSGPLPANSVELLRSERMLAFLRAIEKKADIVIFDSPPAIHVIDAVVMSQILDGVLFVINSGRINRDEALQVKYMIESTKTPIIGVALNNIEVSSPDYYYYYYYGGYGYGSRQRRKRVKLKR